MPHIGIQPSPLRRASTHTHSVDATSSPLQFLLPTLLLQQDSSHHLPCRRVAMRSPLPIPSLSNDAWFAGTSATRPTKADAMAARTMRAMSRHAQDVWSWQRGALPFVKHAAAMLWKQQWMLVLFIGTAATLACLAALFLHRKTSSFRGEESAFDWLRKGVDDVDADKVDFGECCLIVRM